MRNDYNNAYQRSEYDRFSDLDPQVKKKKPSYLTVLLIGLLVFLVCSLGYDNIIKPYLEKGKQQTEKTVATSAEEIEETADMPSAEADDYVTEVGEEAVHESQPVSSKNVSAPASQAPVSATSQREVKTTTKSAESVATVSTSGQSHGRVTSTPSTSEDLSGLSTSEILDRRTHESVVRQAQRAGVSTEGSTSEILDRITHANVVKQAQRAGVSTEGTTSDILDRITHANVVKQAKRIGVSTEGSTSEILDRITRKNMEKMGY